MNVICDVVGSTDKTARPPVKVVLVARDILIRTCGASHAGPVSNEHCAMDIRARVLESWRSKAMDPDDQIVTLAH